MAFKYTPIGQFRIDIEVRTDKLRQKKGEGIRKKQTLQMGYIVKNHDLSFAHLVVHLVPGSKTEWVVSERFTGAKISKKPAQSKDTAVREAIARIKTVGRAEYQQAIANYS